jgi:hypothetical protein
MILNKACIIIRIRKLLTDEFSTWNGLKQGDDLSPELLNFALEYTIRKVQGYSTYFLLLSQL